MDASEWNKGLKIAHFTACRRSWAGRDVADAKHLICALIQQQGSGRCPQKHRAHFFFAYSTSPGEAAASSEPLWGCAWHPKQCQTGNGICDMEREECAIYRSQWHPGRNNRGTTGISGGNQSRWANRDVEIPFSRGRLKQGGHRVSVPHTGQAEGQWEPGLLFFQTILKFKTLLC